MIRLTVLLFMLFFFFCIMPPHPTTYPHTVWVNKYGEKEMREYKILKNDPDELTLPKTTHGAP